MDKGAVRGRGGHKYCTTLPTPSPEDQGHYPLFPQHAVLKSPSDWKSFFGFSLAIAERLPQSAKILGVAITIDAPRARTRVPPQHKGNSGQQRRGAPSSNLVEILIGASNLCVPSLNSECLSSRAAVRNYPITLHVRHTIHHARGLCCVAMNVLGLGGAAVGAVLLGLGLKSSLYTGKYVQHLSECGYAKVNIQWRVGTEQCSLAD